MSSFTEENYLKAIYHLSNNNELTVTTTSISELFNITAASVTDMLKKLSDKQLINYKKYQGVTLTNSGIDTAIEVIRKHRLWEVFLVEKLGFKWDEVHEIAEDLEHVNSKLLTERLDNFLGNPKVDPHGDPIPDKNGKMNHRKLLKISTLKPNQAGTISGISEHSTIFLKYLEKTGLILGTKIKIKEIIEFDGSAILVLDNGKEVSISREAANNILVCYE